MFIGIILVTVLFLPNPPPIAYMIDGECYKCTNGL